MQFVRVFSTVLLFGAFVVSAVQAQTESSSDVAGHFQFRLRGLAVVPEAGGEVTAAGKRLPGSLSVSDSFIPEVDATYFLTDHIGIEAIAGTTRHSPHLNSVGDLGSVWLLPPTITAQYHFDPDGAIRPYVGVGANYTFFYNSHSGAVPEMKYQNGPGGALQAGVDIPFGDGPYFLNFDVKQLLLTTGIKADGGLVRGHANLNPLLAGAGVGIRF